MLPCCLLGGNPGGGGIKRGRIEREDMVPTDNPPPDQPCSFQDPDVFGDSVQGHGKRRGDLSHPRFTLGKATDDGAPGGICKRQECDVESHREPLHENSTCWLNSIVAMRRGQRRWAL